MRELIRRIGRDLRQLRNIDAYAVALLAFVLAVLSVAGDILPGNSRWAVLFAGLGLARALAAQEIAGPIDELADQPEFLIATLSKGPQRGRSVPKSISSTGDICPRRRCCSLTDYSEHAYLGNQIEGEAGDISMPGIETGGGRR